MKRVTSVWFEKVYMYSPSLWRYIIAWSPLVGLSRIFPLLCVATLKSNSKILTMPKSMYQGSYLIYVSFVNSKSVMLCKSFLPLSLPHHPQNEDASDRKNSTVIWVREYQFLFLCNTCETTKKFAYQDSHQFPLLKFWHENNSFPFAGMCRKLDMLYFWNIISIYKVLCKMIDW